MPSQPAGTISTWTSGFASFQSATIFSVASIAAGWSDSDWNFSVTVPPSVPSSPLPPRWSRTRRAGS